MMILWFFIGVATGAVISYFFIKSKNISRTQYDILVKEREDFTATLNEARNSGAVALARLEEKIKNSQERLDSLNNLYEEEKSEARIKQNEINSLKEEIAKILANNKSLEEKLFTQKEEIFELHKNSQIQFQNIANQILEEKSNKFTEVNKANIQALLKPLGENIEGFKKKVEETYDKESKQRFSLEEQIKNLLQETNKISSEANNLTNALKGQVKKQGSWGEMILESILQQSGLMKDIQYSKERNIKDEDGNNLRPDFLIYLPQDDKGNKRTIISDSKVSLIAYDKFASSDSHELQAIYLKEHLDSLYRHIDQLSEKKYDDLENSVDFTIMFIPIEPAYLTAIQSDSQLWSYAYKKRILLMSPTNLIVCLKLVSDLWKRDMQSKNALEIVKRGEALYEKFVGFSQSILEIGKHIENSQSAYNKALGQLKTGRGNLIDQATKLKSLGLKSHKIIPESLMPNDMDELVIANNVDCEIEEVVVAE